MALYLISYDINEKDAWEYDRLYSVLKEMRATRILYSEWVVAAVVGQALTLYNRVATTIQQKDRLLVQEVLYDSKWDKLLIPDEEFTAFLQFARR